MSWILIFRKFPLFLSYFLPSCIRYVQTWFNIIRNLNHKIYIYICIYKGTEKLICRRQRKFFDAILRIVANRGKRIFRWKDRATEVLEYFRLSDTLRATVHLDPELEFLPKIFPATKARGKTATHRFEIHCELFPPSKLSNPFIRVHLLYAHQSNGTSYDRSIK